MRTVRMRAYSRNLARAKSWSAGASRGRESYFRLPSVGSPPFRKTVYFPALA